MSWHHLDPEKEVVVPRVNDCRVNPAGSDPFGKVSNSFLRISGPLKQRWLVPGNLWTEQFEFWVDDWKEELKQRAPGRQETSLGRAWLDVYEDDDAKGLSADVQVQGSEEQRVKTCCCLEISTHHGLWLEEIRKPIEVTPSPSAGTDWRRVGVVDFNTERGPEWWRGVEETELKIL